MSLTLIRELRRQADTVSAWLLHSRPRLWAICSYVLVNWVSYSIKKSQVGACCQEGWVCDRVLVGVYVALFFLNTMGYTFGEIVNTALADATPVFCRKAFWVLRSWVLNSGCSLGGCHSPNMIYDINGGTGLPSQLRSSRRKYFNKINHLISRWL